MMRFTPPTEITPEPAPEIVMNYDESCLPNVDETTENIIESGEGESLSLVTIPPLEGEFTLLETGTMQESNCTGIEPVGFECMLGEDEVFTYSNPNPDFAFISINNPDGGDIITINHHPDIPNELYIGTSPSWGLVNHDENHYRLAFACYSATHGNRACFWDSLEDDYTMIDLSAGSPMMSPLGTKVLHRRGVGTYQYTIGSSQIPRIYPNHNTSQWSTDTIFYLQYDVYTQYGVPTGEKRIIIYPYTGTNSIIVSDNNLQTLFDVNANGDILYWKRIGSDYQLWRYIHSSQTNTPMLPVMPKMSRVHWSPDGTTFILLYETVTNGPACIRWYDLLTATPQTDNYLTIACDIQGHVDWAGNIDLRFMLPEPNPEPKCSDPNDFRKLTEENTNLADREACWLRYKEIIYLTIYHEFSMDEYIALTLNQLNEILSNKTYRGAIDTIGKTIEFPTQPLRIITSEELLPFQNYPDEYDIYNLFARAIINGMMKAARSGTNPMGYFAHNYSSTVSENWMGYTNLQNRQITEQKLAILASNVGMSPSALYDIWISGQLPNNIQEAANDLNLTQANWCYGVLRKYAHDKYSCDIPEWYTATTELSYNSAIENDFTNRVNAYNNLIGDEDNAGSVVKAILGMLAGSPIISEAVNGELDSIEIAFNQSTFSVLPANKLLPNTIIVGIGEERREVKTRYSEIECFNPPLGPTQGVGESEAYVFHTYLGGLWKLLWSPERISACDPRITIYHPSSIWEHSPDGGHFAPVDMYDNWCVYVNETLSQSYMRHLRETYSTNTFRALSQTPRYEVDNNPYISSRTSTSNNDIDEFDVDLTRFGMSDYSIHIPILKVSYHNDGTIRQLIWETIRFQYTPPNDRVDFPIGSPPTIRGHFTRPITRREFILTENVNGEIQTIQPLDTCPNP